jgi:hypothetical protein
MTDSNDVTFDAKVARYDIARLRLGQLVLPFAVVTTVVASRMPSVATATVAFAVLAVGCSLLYSAVKRFGWQPLRFERGGVSIGSTGVRIEQHKVHQWTLLDGSARLYGLGQSFRFQLRSGCEQKASALLRQQFGPPRTLQRRGSNQARMIALGVAVCGLALAALAMVNESQLLAFIGAPAFVLGTATFGALSQRRG